MGTHNPGICYVGVRCLNTRYEVSLTYDSIMNVITDVMILCLQIKFVLELQMNRARKIQALIAFDLGGMSVAAQYQLGTGILTVSACASLAS